MAHPEAEIRAAHDQFLMTRDQIERLERPWEALADFFTEEAWYVDPAWGRVEGLESIRKFLGESMLGLEDWSFPTQWTLVEGDRLVSCWMNRLPGQRADGSHYEAPGISTFEYAGNGKFASSYDLLNMAHVHELIAESGWRPGPGAVAPPRNPLR
ncbi:MAG TPA: nuclear transport factor 2 family protein [Myxococcales bacterium]|nr:nuclear transport factor 2 family protein [Myxococcales bacterium]HIL00441.1 nuclear transport factor 2 family protein [Myxococcales bacterium]